MTPNEYQQLALTTESTHVPLESMRDSRLLHAAMGCCTEAGELQDTIKRELFYGKTAEPSHQVEEFGDLLWYIAIGLDALGMTMEDCMQRNIAKLKTRYPEKFTEHHAIHRDLEAERAALGGE